MMGGSQGGGGTPKGMALYSTKEIKKQQNLIKQQQQTLADWDRRYNELATQRDELTTDYNELMDKHNSILMSEAELKGQVDSLKKSRATVTGTRGLTNARMEPEDEVQLGSHSLLGTR